LKINDFDDSWLAENVMISSDSFMKTERAKHVAERLELDI